MEKAKNDNSWYQRKTLLKSGIIQADDVLRKREEFAINLRKTKTK